MTQDQQATQYEWQARRTAQAERERQRLRDMREVREAAHQAAEAARGQR
ncbi:hypothetical protein [Kineosporia sp. NBRC 101731]|nr:hypothetical protein [Kineosporia sp. NBRC 101731]GLY32070.1 hypothetical protein Kisp02_54350 [Kineosporia sp. NBRC 101731]